MASQFDLLHQSPKDIQAFLEPFKAKLRQTKFPRTHMIQFDATTQSEDPQINLLRGVIFTQSEDPAGPVTVKALGFPVPTEYKKLAPQSQEQVVDQLTALGAANYTVQEVQDGTLIRLWYHEEEDRWVLSTNGTEDAGTAFWINGISFSDQFADAVQGEMGPYNKDHVYLFTLCHPQNVIVVNHRKPALYYLATYDRKTLREVPRDPAIHLPESPKTLPGMTVQEVIQSMECAEAPVQRVGHVIILPPNEEGIVYRYRFENNNYTEARFLRGESNNLDFTVLGHMLGGDPVQLKMFLDYFPQYKGLETSLLTRLDKLCNTVYQFYVARYIQRHQFVIHPRLHKLLGEIQTNLYYNYLKPQNRKVHLIDVEDYIHGLPVAKVLYTLGYETN
jgi:hypothetical protein